MTAAQRSAIQTDLIWTGHYVGLVDGDFGDGSVSAVKAYQKRASHDDTGILTAQEREQLAAAAKSKQAEVGWRVVDGRVPRADETPG